MNPPTNRATIISGSATVKINGKPAAARRRPAPDLQRPVPLPVGHGRRRQHGAHRWLRWPSDFLGRGLAFPFAARPRTAGWSLVGGEDKIRQSIWIILSTAPGERLMRPDFGCGIHDLVFEPNTAALRGHGAGHGARGPHPLGAAHRRARRAGGAPPTSERNHLFISIDYRIRSNNAFYNLVYPFFLNEGVGFPPRPQLRPEVRHDASGPDTRRPPIRRAAAGAATADPDVHPGVGTRLNDWTDWNESDPGTTLLQLWAHLAEVILYRLNRLPDLAYVKFLELVGLRLRPARAATADLTFTPQPGFTPPPHATGITVPRVPKSLAQPPAAANP